MPMVRRDHSVRPRISAEANRDTPPIHPDRPVIVGCGMKQAVITELIGTIRRWEKAEGIQIRTYMITELGPRVIYTDLKERHPTVHSTSRRFENLHADIAEILKKANIDYIEIVRDSRKTAMFYHKLGYIRKNALWLKDAHC